jgi:hypothetical protein
MSKTTAVCVGFLGAVMATMGCGELPADDTVIEGAESALTNCSPGPNQIVWSLDPLGNPLSSCGYLNLGFYPTPDTAPYSFPNDAIGSIKLGPGMRAVIFSNAHYGGSKTIISSTALNLPKTTSSIRVERITDTCEASSFGPPPGAVAFYTDYNYQGDCTTLHSTDVCVWVNGASGEFANPDQCMGLTNDIISSARFGSQSGTELFNNINFEASGGTQVIQTGFSGGLQPDFRNVLLQFQNQSRSADNAVTSLIVFSD